MPNVNAVLNDQIRRLARREISSNTRVVKKASAHYRRDIAALKRHVTDLTKLVRDLQQRIPTQALAPAPEVVQNARLRIDGLKAHRARLGLSAKEYGKLLGVSSLTVYHWEAGKSKPRRSQLPSIVAVRGIGKREAMRRLGIGEEAPMGAAPAGPKPQKAGKKPGKGQQTAVEFVLSLLKGRKSLSSAEINAAWKKAGRAGNADNTLSIMTKGKMVKRTKIKGARGSEYRLG